MIWWPANRGIYHWHLPPWARCTIIWRPANQGMYCWCLTELSVPWKIWWLVGWLRNLPTGTFLSWSIWWWLGREFASDTYLSWVYCKGSGSDQMGNSPIGRCPELSVPWRMRWWLAGESTSGASLSWADLEGFGGWLVGWGIYHWHLPELNSERALKDLVAGWLAEAFTNWLAGEFTSGTSLSWVYRQGSGSNLLGKSPTGTSLSWTYLEGSGDWPARDLINITSLSWVYLEGSVGWLENSLNGFSLSWVFLEGSGRLAGQRSNHCRHLKFVQ